MKARQVGQRNHIDVVGLGGIGKTHFTMELTTRLGVMSPTPIPVGEFSSEWNEFFETEMSRTGQILMSPNLGWEKKAETVRLLSGRLESENKALHRPIHAVALNTESLLRSRWDEIADLASSRPEFVFNLLRERLILVCDTDDPVNRSLRGRKKRGDDVTDTPQFRKKLYNQYVQINEGADALASLGIPVHTISLDRSISHNVTSVANFLHENGVTSRKIRRRARHAM